MASNRSTLQPAVAPTCVTMAGATICTQLSIYVGPIMKNILKNASIFYSPKFNYDRKKVD